MRGSWYFVDVEVLVFDVVDVIWFVVGESDLC